MPRKVVVAVFGDDAASRDALALGVLLARVQGGELVLAASWASVIGRGGGAYGRAVREEVERVLEELGRLVPGDVPARTSAREASSALRALHELVDRDDDDVLVFSAADLKRRGRGNLALETLHDAPCAVAVAPGGYATATPADDVAVAWADAPEAEAALEAGVRIAVHTGGTLRVVHVLTAPTQLADEPWLDASNAQHWLVSTRPAGVASLARAVELVANRVPVATELRDGLVDQEVARAAASCGVIVAGSRGYGSLRRLILGSTTAGLLREATVPVLITPRAVAERAAATRDATAPWTA